MLQKLCEVLNETVSINYEDRASMKLDFIQKLSSIAIYRLLWNVGVFYLPI